MLKNSPIKPKNVMNISGNKTTRRKCKYLEITKKYEAHVIIFQIKFRQI